MLRNVQNIFFSRNFIAIRCLDKRMITTDINWRKINMVYKWFLSF